MSKLKEILDMAKEIEPSHAAMQELILLAFNAGKEKKINKQSEELAKFNNPKNRTRPYDYQGNLMPEHALYGPYLK